MKKRITQILMLIGLVSAAPAWSAQTVTVHVNGMVCDFCARGLSKGFSAYLEKGVLEAFTVELAKHTVTLKVKDGVALSDVDITKVIEDSSMAVGKIER